MKKCLLWKIGLLLLPVWGYTQGVDFRQVSYAEATELAAKEKKMIFIDFYTTWCGPCKQMSKEVFPQKEVGDFFNPRFISLKMDAEKGEGKGLAVKYKIRAYPTFVVLKADGTEIYCTSGARPASEFTEKIRKGIDPAWSPDGLTRRYTKGERTPELVHDYTLLLLEQGKTKEGMEVLENYFDALSPKKRVKPVNFFLYEQFATNLSDRKAQYLFEHKDSFVKANGRDTVEKILTNWLRIELVPYFTLRSPEPLTKEGLQQVKEKIIKAELQETGKLKNLTEIAEARMSGDWKQYLEICKSKLPELDMPDRFSILMNLTELDNEPDEIKSGAATLIRDNLEGIEGYSQRILKTQMYRLEGKQEYTFQAEVEGAESGKVVMMTFSNRGFAQDTFPFSNHKIVLSVAGKDTLQMSLRIMGDSLGVQTPNLGMNYPTLPLLLVPGEFAVMKLKLQKGKVPQVKWLRGGEVSHDFVRLNHEIVQPAEQAYRQLMVDNIIRGGDIREYKEEFEAYRQANKETIMGFVRNNPAGFVTAMNLLEHYIWFDENEIERIYEQFPVPLKTTRYGRILKRKLDAGKPYRTGSQIQPFTKKDMNGKTISSSQWKGKYVLLDFWGSWCGPCRASHLHLKELYQKYGRKMIFVNVAQENVKDLAEARKSWKQAVREDGLTWTQVLNNEGAETCNLLQLFYITSFPTKILIDPEGRIAGRYVGATTDITQKLKEVMGF